MHKNKKKLLSGFSANAFGQFVSIFIQVASLPLYIKYWGVGKYGEWLLMTSIPAYFSMLDMGLANVAGNSAMLAAAQGKHRKAANFIRSAELSIIVICLCVFVIGIFVLFVLPVYVTGNNKLVYVFLLSNVLLIVATGIYEAIFKVSGKYAESVYAVNLIRFFEWIFGIFGLIFFGEFLHVAIGMVLARLIGFFAMKVMSKKYLSINYWKIGKLKKIYVINLVKPSAFYMLFPISNAISIQGSTLFVGYVSDVTWVVLYNAYRTIVRTAVQFVGIISHALAPEFSVMVGKRNFIELKKLYEKYFLISNFSAAIILGLVFLSGKLVIDFWSKKEIQFVEHLFVGMLCYAFFSCLWHVPRILMMSANMHKKLSIYVLLTAILALVGAKIFHFIGFDGVDSLVFSMAFFEFCLAAIAIYLANSFIKRG